MRAWVLTGLVCDLLIGSLLLDYAHSSYRGATVASGIITLLYLVHALYLPVYMLVSLAREWGKSGSIWLSIPQAGRALLASKLTSGLAGMLASLLVTAAMAAWIAAACWHQLEANATFRGVSLARTGVAGVLLTPESLRAVIVRLAAWAALAMLGFGLYAGFWLSLASISAQALKHSLRKARWLAGAVILLIPTWGWAELGSWPLFQSALNWGRFDVALYTPVRAAVHIAHRVAVPLYTGQLLFFVLILCSVFLLAGWLIDRKVEV